MLECVADSIDELEFSVAKATPVHAELLIELFSAFLNPIGIADRLDVIDRVRNKQVDAEHLIQLHLSCVDIGFQLDYCRLKNRPYVSNVVVAVFFFHAKKMVAVTNISSKIVPDQYC